MTTHAAPLPGPASWRTWLAACRPATLPAAAAPVLVGTACAAALNGLRPLSVLAALLGSLLIQVGTNLANDVFDAEKGADTAERTGPVRAVAAGLLSARAVRQGMWISFALATLCGLYLIATAGWPVLVIGLVSIASGIAYTGGPWPLGYHGLGDVFVMIFFGFVAVCGTVFVQMQQVPVLAVVASVPVGALATAILVVNNLRDRHTDVKAGKRTLAVRFGRTFVLAEYILLIVAAKVAIVALALMLHSPWPLLALVTTPMGLRLWRRVAANEGAALNPLLGATARLMLLQAVLLSTGLVLAGR